MTVRGARMRSHINSTNDSFVIYALWYLERFRPISGYKSINQMSFLLPSMNNWERRLVSVCQCFPNTRCDCGVRFVEHKMICAYNPVGHTYIYIHFSVCFCICLLKKKSVCIACINLCNDFMVKMNGNVREFSWYQQCKTGCSILN